MLSQSTTNECTSAFNRSIIEWPITFAEHFVEKIKQYLQCNHYIYMQQECLLKGETNLRKCLLEVVWPTGMLSRHVTMPTWPSRTWTQRPSSQNRMPVVTTRPGESIKGTDAIFVQQCHRFCFGAVHNVAKAQEAYNLLQPRVYRCSYQTFSNLRAPSLHLLIRSPVLSADVVQLAVWLEKVPWPHRITSDSA